MNTNDATSAPTPAENPGEQLPPIVSPEWLDEHRDSVVLCDVRYYLDGRDGPAAFEQGHLPGAVYIDMDTVLASSAGPVVGRHPLPTPETFAAGLAAAGIGPNDSVVVYDDLNGMVAGRLVWMLRVLGQPAALLDGGFTTWTAREGSEIETGPVHPEPTETPVRAWPDGVFLDADAVADVLDAGGVVADSRAAERYRGDTEPIDARAGHVPGAINLAFTDNLAADGRFKSPDELNERFRASGVDADTVFYCGSGVSACVNLLAAEHAGLGSPKLYVGSWSGWSSDPSRDVATGDEP